MKSFLTWSIVGPNSKKNLHTQIKRFDRFGSIFRACYVNSTRVTASQNRHFPSLLKIAAAPRRRRFKIMPKFSEINK